MSKKGSLHTTPHAEVVRAVYQLRKLAMQLQHVRPQGHVKQAIAPWLVWTLGAGGVSLAALGAALAERHWNKYRYPELFRDVIRLKPGTGVIIPGSAGPHSVIGAQYAIDQMAAREILDPALKAMQARRYLEDILRNPSAYVDPRKMRYEVRPEFTYPIVTVQVGNNWKPLEIRTLQDLDRFMSALKPEVQQNIEQARRFPTQRTWYEWWRGRKTPQELFESLTRQGFQYDPRQGVLFADIPGLGRFTYGTQGLVHGVSPVDLRELQKVAPSASTYNPYTDM